MPVAIRPASVTDLDAISRFAADVVPVHYSPILGENAARAQLEWWTEDRMRPAVEAGDVHVAEQEDDIVGVVETGVMGEDRVVWKLYVAPASRGRSVGARLLDRSVAPLREATDHVLIEHFAGNTDAARFYERQGWRVVRTDASAEGDPRAVVVWRRLDLDG